MNVRLLEKAIGKYYEDQKLRHGIAPTMCEGTHGTSTPAPATTEEMMEKAVTVEEVIAIEKQIIRELRPNLPFGNEMRLEQIIDIENGKREV